MSAWGISHLNSMKELGANKVATLEAFEREYLAHIAPEVRKECILCLDPGETMGWTVFVDAHILRCGQLPIKTQLAQGRSISHALNIFFDDLVGVEPADGWPGVTVDACVMEDYVVYGHKMQANIWNPLFTVRLIGALQFACSERKIPIIYQMASEVKFFATDDKLKRWGLFQEKLKHTNDSVRHGVYYMLRKSSMTRRNGNDKQRA